MLTLPRRKKYGSGAPGRRPCHDGFPLASSRYSKPGAVSLEESAGAGGKIGDEVLAPTTVPLSGTLSGRHFSLLARLGGLHYSRYEIERAADGFDGCRRQVEKPWHAADENLLIVDAGHGQLGRECFAGGTQIVVLGVEQHHGA